MSIYKKVTHKVCVPESHVSFSYHEENHSVLTQIEHGSVSRIRASPEGRIIFLSIITSHTQKGIVIRILVEKGLSGTRIGGLPTQTKPATDICYRLLFLEEFFDYFASILHR